MLYITTRKHVSTKPPVIEIEMEMELSGQNRRKSSLYECIWQYGTVFWVPN